MGEQAITWTNFDQVLWGQIASQGLIELSMHKDNITWVLQCVISLENLLFLSMI